MAVLVEYFRTEGYVMDCDESGSTCLTFWMLASNPDGTFDVLQKDIHAKCNIRTGIAFNLSERQAIDLIRAIEKAAAVEGSLIPKDSANYTRLERDTMFAQTSPLLHQSAYLAAKRLEEMPKTTVKKPNFKFQ